MPEKEEEGDQLPLLSDVVSIKIDLEDGNAYHHAVTDLDAGIHLMFRENGKVVGWGGTWRHLLEALRDAVPTTVQERDGVDIDPDDKREPRFGGKRSMTGGGPFARKE